MELDENILAVAHNVLDFVPHQCAAVSSMTSDNSRTLSMTDRLKDTPPIQATRRDRSSTRLLVVFPHHFHSSDRQLPEFGSVGISRAGIPVTVIFLGCCVATSLPWRKTPKQQQESRSRNNNNNDDSKTDPLHLSLGKPFRADDDIMEDPEEEGRNKTSSVRGHHDAEAPSQKKQKTEKSPSANALDNLVKKLEADESFEALDVEEGDVEPVLSTFRGRKHPTRGDGTAASNNAPDLLLCTLTHEDRHNGAATNLRGALKSEPLLVHGLSGAGKTRALLDVLANNNGEQGSWEHGGCIDLGNMASGQLPKKNFRQTDVNWMRDVEEGVASNTRARHCVQCLVLARAVLLHVLEKKGWVGCHLLCAQLGTGCGGEKLLEHARTLFFSLLKWEIDDIGDPFAKTNPSMLVVIDEANVALQSSFGSFKATTKEDKNSGRPLLSPLYEVLRGTKSVFAGTNMSFGNVLSTVVSQMAEEGSPPPFNHFTSLIDASQMGSLASKCFGLNRNMEDASILKGRCRFFMLAIYAWLTNPSMAFVDAAAKAAARVRCSHMERRIHD